MWNVCQKFSRLKIPKRRGGFQGYHRMESPLTASAYDFANCHVLYPSQCKTSFWENLFPRSFFVLRASHSHPRKKFEVVSKKYCFPSLSFWAKHVEFTFILLLKKLTDWILQKKINVSTIHYEFFCERQDKSQDLSKPINSWNKSATSKSVADFQCSWKVEENLLMTKDTHWRKTIAQKWQYPFLISLKKHKGER